MAEIAINTLPFWSRFLLDVDLRFDGTNTFRTIFARGTRLPVFDYRKGERNVTALQGAQATSRDTILVQANQTRGGGQYTIHGISFTKDGYPYEAEDAQGLAHSLFPGASVQPANGGAGVVVPTVEDFRSLDSLMIEVFQKFFRMELQIDGTRRILEMGPSILYPGVGGPNGGNVDTTNGGTAVNNYMKIREGIVWNPSGAVDSNLVMSLEAAYDCILPTWTAPDGLAPDGQPIADAVPTALGRRWKIAYIANFHGVEESPTSNIS